MIQVPIVINNETYLLSVDHITRESEHKLIYGISINKNHYFLAKTLGLHDCQQIDSKPLMENVLFMEICDIITEIEKAYKERPSLEFINLEIVRILMRIRSKRFFEHD